MTRHPGGTIISVGGPVTTYLKHPDVHPAASEWSEEQTLWVIGCYSNPFRWRNRREIANDFRRHVEASPNARLIVVELAYGDRPFEVSGPNDLQLRTHCELFHKENLQNLGARMVPPSAKHIAFVDMDFHFTRHDWALETIHQLQHHPWVQMFSSYTDLSGEELGRGHRALGTNNGFAYNYVRNGHSLPPYDPAKGWPDSAAYGGRRVGATGGAWAVRRDAFDACGGLLDRCILGHGDWFMAFGLVGHLAPDMRIDHYHPQYRAYIHAWQERAADACRRDVGYVDGHAIHHWHGPKGKRGYETRDQILVKHAYDPNRDVFPDARGVLQLDPRRWELRDAIRRYFLARSEDVPHGGG
jgi:hypothetical protein